MYEFNLEPDLSLLTVTRTGEWTLDIVKSYESALRAQLERLQQSGRPTSVVLDVRSTGAQKPDVADALRSMVERLGPLSADRIAIVSASGIAKLEKSHIAAQGTQVFTSVVLARDWVTSRLSTIMRPIYDEPSEIEAEGRSVHVIGPSEVDFNLTPDAALEMSKRMEDVAVEVLTAERPRR